MDSTHTPPWFRFPIIERSLGLTPGKIVFVPNSTVNVTWHATSRSRPKPGWHAQARHRTPHWRRKESKLSDWTIASPVPPLPSPGVTFENLEKLFHELREMGGWAE